MSDPRGEIDETMKKLVRALARKAAYEDHCASQVSSDPVTGVPKPTTAHMSGNIDGRR